MLREKIFSAGFGLVLVCLVAVFSLIAFFQTFSERTIPTTFAAASSTATATSTLTITNATPIITTVSINNASSLVLTPNATTAVNVNATVVDFNGCADITNGTATIALYRSSITSSTCLTTQNNLNCYLLTAFSATSSCVSNTTVNTTTTFGVYYFAQATDASSSFASDTMMATVNVRDAGFATATLDSGGVELLTMVAIDLASSSINYGSMNPTSTTGLVNQVASVQNFGNASTSIQVSGTALTFGANVIATSSQHYASSTFNFGGGEGVLSNTATTISGLIINPHVSLVNDLGAWGTTTALPNAVPKWDDGVAVAINGYMYIIGGETNTNVATSGVSYATINNDGTLSAWTGTQSLPTSTTRHSAFAYNGYLYVSGGSNGGGTVVTSSVIYAALNSNGTIGAWANTTALPAGLTRHESFAYNGYAYVLGGLDSAPNTTSAVLYAPISSNGTISSWSSTTAIPGGGRNGFLGVVNKNFAYIIGGGLASVNATTSVWYAPINSNGTIGTWLAGTALPGALAKQVGFVNGDYVYTIGGVDDTGTATTTVLYAAINSDGSLGSWTNATSLPVAAQRQQGAVYRGYAYSMGNITALTSYYAPISNGNSQKDTFWGLGLLNTVPTGTYSGVNTFTAVFSP